MRKRQTTTISRLESKIGNLLFEKSLLEDEFILAVDSNGDDCSEEVIANIDFEIEDIEGTISEIIGS